MNQHRLPKALLTASATATLLLAAACGSDGEPASTTSSEPSASASQEGSTESSGEYADGTYEAEGSYPNPGGTSSVGVELTLEGGTVSDVTVTPQASGTSKQYQDKFESGIADEVVGKKLDDLDVGKVAGSSLTADGFNAALEEIKADAQA